MAALDFPNSPTLNQLYAAPNGATYKWDGTAWIVAAAGPPTELWTDTGTALTPYDATKTVSVPGGAAGAGASTVLLGSNTAKARLQSGNTTQPPWVALTTNRDFNAGVQDDATKPSWHAILNSNADTFSVARNPAGGALATLLALDNAGTLTLTGSTANVNAPDATSALVALTSYGTGIVSSVIGKQARGTTAAPSATQNGDLICQFAAQGYVGGFQTQGQLRFYAQENWTATARGTYCQIFTTQNGQTALNQNLLFDNNGNLSITGSVGLKASGTTWSNPSDPRLKQDIAPYAAGLADICQLAPITYRLKAQPDGPLCYGFDAEKVRDVFPECIGTTRMKLDPDGEEEDVLTFDMHPILVAVITAIKELAAKVDALTKGE